MMKTFLKRQNFFLNKSILKNFSEKNFTIPLTPVVASSEFDTNIFPKQTTTTRTEIMKYLEDLHLMRRMEIECDTLYKAGEIRGFCHLYTGQESIAVGMEAALTYDDHIITAYREHCQQYGRGDSVYRIIAELMGKVTGSTRGKGGSMHLYFKKHNFYGGNGIVGAQIPLGTGIAFGLKYQGKKNVCITMYGDGSANQGQLFEASNMAALWKLPVIYFIENNHYGMGTSVERASFQTHLHAKFRGIPGVKIDGMDVFSIREYLKAAKEFSIQQGPIFFEVDTYRYQGHSMSDPGITYRNRDEVTKIRESRDCINKIKNIILQNGIANEAEVKELEKSVKARVEKDVEQAKRDPFPEIKDMYTHVYVHNEEHFIRGVEYQTSQLPSNQ